MRSWGLPREWVVRQRGQGGAGGGRVQCSELTVALEGPAEEGKGGSCSLPAPLVQGWDPPHLLSCTRMRAGNWRPVGGLRTPGSSGGGS